MHIKHLGLVDYLTTYEAMRTHNRAMTIDSDDEVWLLEHPSVFTLGLAGKPEHILAAGDIPTVKIDRGGQVTYHGPGQLVVYLLLNMRRRRYGVKSLVNRIEQSVIDLLGEYSIVGARREAMPGVYVENAKIAAIGLRVTNHATYHGLALNVDVELAPFQRINPCGYADLVVTRLHDLGVTDKMSVIAEKCLTHLKRNLDD